jgi:hypothetical protein
MLKGDISNELSKRILVTDEIFLETEVSVTKKFKFIPVPKVNRNLNRSTLSFLYLFTVKQGVILELVSFNQSEEDLEKFMEELDKMGTNPFRYFSVYPSVAQLVTELPYRPEVVGVVDKQERLLRYGHWGRSLNEL